MRGALLRWYRRVRRDLPWRRTKDPWAVWVSEVMLQQTRVEVVVPYYERFLQRFPTPSTLARADEEEVLGLWSGLGYYRRARALREGARAVVERHGGRVPSDLDLLLELPGVGRYTAGAIASIAFDRPAPILDGNVRRVLCRVLAEPGSTAAAERRLWDAAARLARGRSPGDLNQALMELGALVCLPRTPRCEECPVAPRCAAWKRGRPEDYPAPRERRPTETVRVAVAWIADRRRVLVARRAEESPLRGAWDLPAVEVAGKRSARRTLEAALGERHGSSVEVGTVTARLEHAILHRRLRLEVFPCRSHGALRSSADARWIDLDALALAPVSGATQKIARALGPPSQGRGPSSRSSSASSRASAGIALEKR